MANISVIESISLASNPSNRRGLALGAAGGALAPVGVFAIVHVDGVLALSTPLWEQPVAYLALGGLVFSAMSVVVWTERLFMSRAKAIGWTVLCEGLMTLAPHQLAWLAWICLAYLVGINAISNGCNAALDRKASRPASKASRANVRNIRKVA